jgi:hypothetical protein
MRALLGMCYMRGLLGANLTKVNELWGPDYSVMFGATMSCHRFKFLLSNLRYVSTFYGSLHIILFPKNLKQFYYISEPKRPLIHPTECC